MQDTEDLVLKNLKGCGNESLTGPHKLGCMRLPTARDTTCAFAQPIGAPGGSGKHPFMSLIRGDVPASALTALLREQRLFLLPS